MLGAARFVAGARVVTDRVVDVVTLQRTLVASDAAQRRMHGAGTCVRHPVGLGHPVLELPAWRAQRVRLAQVQEVGHHVLQRGREAGGP